MQNAQPGRTFEPEGVVRETMGGEAGSSDAWNRHGSEMPTGLGVGRARPDAVAEGADVQFIALDGVSPTDAGYPCLARVGIGYSSDRQENVQPLIDWLSSENGRAALREVDVIVP